MQIQIKNLIIIIIGLFSFLGVAYGAIAPNAHDQKLIEYGQLEQQQEYLHNQSDNCRTTIDDNSTKYNTIEVKQNQIWKELYDPDTKKKLTIQ